MGQRDRGVQAGENSDATKLGSRRFLGVQSLRLWWPFALPGVPWLLGRRQRLVARLDCDDPRLGDLPTARAALDVLAWSCRRLPWFLTWCHSIHLLSAQVDFDVVVDLRRAESSIARACCQHVV